jgi:hypothetical protein
MLCLQYACPAPLPLPGQAVRAPFVVMRDSSEQGDRQRVEVELFEDVVDQIRPVAALVDPVECVACSLHRQCGYIEGFTAGRNGGDTRGDAEENVVEATQLVQRTVNLLGIFSLRVENRFNIVEDNEHDPGG